MITKARSLLMAAIIVILMIVSTSPALAGGDQVRGDKGQGGVQQVQVQDPPPFQP